MPPTITPTAITINSGTGTSRLESRSVVDVRTDCDTDSFAAGLAGAATAADTGAIAIEAAAIERIIERSVIMVTLSSQSAALKHENGSPTTPFGPSRS